MKKVFSTIIVLFLVGICSVSAQDTTIVSGTTGTTTWTKDNVYLIQGYVRVDNGETLTIEAGTIVLADTGSLENASALIIERNGTILAEGTAAEPIIFTSLLDDTNTPFDLLDKQTLGLWGGIIMCGDATTNTANNGSAQVEGIPSTLPATVGTYGGTTDDDNSGMMKYVSIRHTGIALASNNEIQGLTLAGVGNGTVLEHIESYASADDGIEIFGGTVNLKWITIAFAEDDGLDYDQGYTGKIQHLFVLQAAGFGDRLGEWDGADSPEDGSPYGAPTIYNATFIGSLPAGTDKRTITFRANGGGKVYNSIFMEQNRGIDIQYKSDANVSESSYDRFVAGDLDMSNNIFWNIGGNTTSGLFKIDAIAGGWVDSATAVSAAITDIETYLSANNDNLDPLINGLSYTDDFGLDPRFGAWEVLDNRKISTDAFFTPTAYKGAFGQAADGLWVKGWTALDHYGYLVESPSAVTSVEKALIPAGFDIYPNPTEGIFTVEASELNVQEVTIKVVSMTGAEVYNATANTAGGFVRSEINLSDFPAALYIVEMRAGDKYSLQRLVIE